jgi:hypothetical protein
MAAATTTPSPAELARALHEVAERMERGEEVSPEIRELAQKLAVAENEHARMRKIMEGVADRHAAILDALAK